MHDADAMVFFGLDSTGVWLLLLLVFFRGVCCFEDGLNWQE